MAQVFAFDPPERFVAGTVGPPGERVFYLQARGGGRVVSVVVEKVQVALLAERLDQLLDEVRRRFGGEVDVSATGPEDAEPLDTPVEAEFRVETLGLSWDADDGRVVIEAQAAQEAAGGSGDVEPEPGPDREPDTLRVRLTAAQVRGFAARARRVVAAGRPPCPFCGLPLDPRGHVCPRQNGHRG